MLILTIIGIVLAATGVYIQYKSWNKRPKATISIDEVLEKLRSKPANPLFSTEDIRNAFFSKHKETEVLSALEILENLGRVKRIDCSTCQDGIRICWIPIV